MNAIEHAPSLLGLPEVAARLHKSERWLKDFLRQHPFGRKAGRTWLFTEADLFAIENTIDRLAKGVDLTDKAEVGAYARVYIVGFGTYIKIGTSRSEKGLRVRGLQTGIPEELKVYAYLEGGRELEAALHRKFKTYRLRGEWFRKRDTLKAWLADGCPVTKKQGREGVRYTFGLSP